MNFIVFMKVATCGQVDIPDYGGGGGSPGSPERHHCSSTTQPMGMAEVITIFAKV